MAPDLKRIRTTRGESGLTLVEVLVGISLLAYIAMSVMSLAVLAVHLNDLSEERTVATALATDRIQQVAAVPLLDAANSARYGLPQEVAVVGPPQTFTADYGAIPDHPQYRRVVELNYDVPVAGMLAVETRVTWRRPGGQEKTHTMVTYLHPGLD